MSAELKATRDQATLILTISNPEAGNALHPDIYAAAIETLSTAERDDSIRAVILTGDDDFFCSDTDLNRLLENRRKDAEEQREAIDRLQGWIDALRGCPKPVIAAVEGVAAGAGFSLALACDLVVAGRSAQFQMPSVTAGLTPNGGGSWFLPQTLPRQLAMEIMLDGKTISAQRLHEAGLVNKMAADGTAFQTAMDWANDLGRLPPHAVERIKSLINEAQTNTLAQHFIAEKESFIEALQHNDERGGMQTGKRKPIC